MAKLNKKVDHSLVSDFSLVDASLELYKAADSQKELDLVKEILKKETQYVEILLSPDIREDEKKKLIDNVFKDNVSEPMLKILKKIFLRYTDVLSVTAITAVPMNEKSRSRLKDILSQKLDKDIVLVNEIDASIIGGVLLKVGDKILDGTLGSELESIKKTLKEISL